MLATNSGSGELTLSLPTVKDWTPESPELYTAFLECIKNRDINTLSEIFSETEELLEEMDENVLVIPETIDKKENKKSSKQIDIPTEETIDEILEKLNSLVGLEEVKKEVNKVITYLKFLEKSKDYIKLSSLI